MCRFKSCLGHHTLDRRTQKAALGRLRRASPVPKRHTILKSMMTNDNLKSFAIVSRRDTDSEGVAKKIRERLQSLNYTEDLDTPDEVIVVGGDGSFLYAVHKYTDILEKTVFIGVHTGTLGFFMDYKDTELDEFIADITPGDLPIEEYPVLNSGWR